MSTYTIVDAALDSNLASEDVNSNASLDFSADGLCAGTRTKLQVKLAVTSENLRSDVRLGTAAPTLSQAR